MCGKPYAFKSFSFRLETCTFSEHCLLFAYRFQYAATGYSAYVFLYFLSFSRGSDFFIQFNFFKRVSVRVCPAAIVIRVFSTTIDTEYTYRLSCAHLFFCPRNYFMQNAFLVKLIYFSLVFGSWPWHFPRVYFRFKITLRWSPFALRMIQH